MEPGGNQRGALPDLSEEFLHLVRMGDDFRLRLFCHAVDNIPGCDPVVILAGRQRQEANDSVRMSFQPAVCHRRHGAAEILMLLIRTVELPSGCNTQNGSSFFFRSHMGQRKGHIRGFRH